MRILHHGNVAQNGYNNAKLQRREGIEADALVDEQHILSQPEWEEADLPPGEYETMAPLAAAAARFGWTRPDWVLPVSIDEPRRRFKGQLWLANRLRVSSAIPRLHRIHRELLRDYAPVRETLGRDLSLADVLWGATWMVNLGRMYGFSLPRLFHGYDVLQGYATHPIFALLAAPQVPIVAFEHGTLREIPFEDSPRGRLLSVAYRRADRVIITNPDVLASAERLGLERYTFVPHPVDEDKYTPGPSPLRADLDAASDRLVLYAPARHDWRDKGNDILLRGFASFARGRPDRRPLLLLTSWGAEIERSRRLVAELGVGDLVRWDPPLPKRRMIEAYRAADIVLDQFAYGTFGGVVPEAMACGRPVILAFDAALHRWCFPELPPVLDARTDAAVAARLEQLADDTGLRDRIGRDGREWVESHHGWRLVVARHRAIYEEILDRRSG